MSRPFTVTRRRGANGDVVGYKLIASLAAGIAECAVVVEDFGSDASLTVVMSPERLGDLIRALREARDSADGVGG